MQTFVRVVINTADLKDLVPEEMVGQALVPYAKFVQRQYLNALNDIPNVTVLVSARRKVPHCALGPVATVKRVNYRLARMKPERFAQQFADEMIAQGTALLAAMEQEKETQRDRIQVHSSRSPETTGDGL